MLQNHDCEKLAAKPFLSRYRHLVWLLLLFLVPEFIVLGQQDGEEPPSGGEEQAREAAAALNEAGALFDEAEVPQAPSDAAVEEGGDVEATSAPDAGSTGYIEEYVDDTYEDAEGYGSQEEAFFHEATEVPVHPVTLEFQDARLTDILQILGEENGVNFIYDHQAHSGKRVTMTLKNVSWESALRAVLEVHGLGFTKLHGGVVKIEAAQERERRRIYASHQLLLTRLSYMKASDANTIVSEFLKGTIVEGAPEPKIQVDERTNTLIVEAPAEALSRVKALVERLDTQTPQVKIDARIVEVQTNKAEQYGIQWGAPVAGSPPTGLNVGSLPINVGSNFAVQAPAQSQVGSLTFRLSPLTSVQEVMMQLQWEERHIGTRILQNTSTIVLNNETATIESGLEDNFEPLVEGSEGMTVSYLLKMTVEPQVTSDGSVSMKVAVESDDPVDNAGTNRKSTKKVETHLIRASGETAAIGGIKTSTKVKGSVAMPYLSQIPIIGWLFKNSSETLDQREIIILITPTVLNLDEMRGGASVASTVGDDDYGYNNYNNYGGSENYNLNQDYENNYGYNEQANQGYGEQGNQGYNNDYAENQGYNQDYNNQGYDNYADNYNQEGSYSENASSNYDDYYNDESYNSYNAGGYGEEGDDAGGGSEYEDTGDGAGYGEYY